MAEQPQHWPTERMINEGHADFATREDLEGVDDTVLLETAEICLVTEAAPDECIPCWAYAEYMERQQTRLASMAPQINAEDHPDLTEEQVDYLNSPNGDELRPGAHDLGEIPEPTPAWHEGIPIEVHKRAPVETLRLQVEMLATTLDDILHGPPIPPKDVSLADLALLSLGAEKWVKMTEAQGITLSNEQQQMLDATKALVARFRS